MDRLLVSVTVASLLALALGWAILKGGD